MSRKNKDKKIELVEAIKKKDRKKLKKLKKDKELYKDFVNAHKPKRQSLLKKVFKNER